MKHPLSLRRRSRRWSLGCCTLAVLALAACATDPVAMELVVCDAGTGPECVDGSLSLTVSGLPEDMSASVTVTGESGFSMTVTSSSTLRLLAGEYTVEADPVYGVDTAYDPETAAQTVSVSGETAVTVKYVQRVEGG
ncbi:MAG: hypothetical protein R3253_06270 [Longimicrobiales bacterium]|nr:hypothetical protein [Longimicrobiales bacterium]